MARYRGGYPSWTPKDQDGGDEERPAKGKGKGKGKGTIDCRVFVGNLAYSVSWQNLKDHMRAAGNVLYCNILPAPGTALNSKGCGIVEYSTPEEAQQAIDELNDTVLNNRQIFVREDKVEKGSKGGGKGYYEESWEKPPVRGKSSGKGTGGRSVYVGNLAYNITWKELKDHMRQAGDVVHCDILPAPGTTLGSKGCGTVLYRTPAEAQYAIDTMSESWLGGRPIYVREDREEWNSWNPTYGGYSGGGGGGYGGNAARKVFVGNLPYSATWKDLKDHMRSVGDVRHCDILPEHGTPCGSKGCGVVEYWTVKDAKKAIQELTETDLNGRTIWVREYSEY